jgi:hypothetical protein
MQDHCEEVLSEILSIFDRVAAARDKHEDWSPVRLTQFCQGLASGLIVSGRVGAAQDNTPARRREGAGARTVPDVSLGGHCAQSMDFAGILGNSKKARTAAVRNVVGNYGSL